MGHLAKSRALFTEQEEEATLGGTWAISPTGRCVHTQEMVCLGVREAGKEASYRLQAESCVDYTGRETARSPKSEPIATNLKANISVVFSIASCP